MYKRQAHTINGCVGHGNVHKQFLGAQERRSPSFPLTLTTGSIAACAVCLRAGDVLAVCLRAGDVLAVCLRAGDVLAVIAESRQFVDESFSRVCDELTSAGWHVTPVLLAADEWRADWRQYHHQHHADDDRKKLY